MRCEEKKRKEKKRKEKKYNMTPSHLMLHFFANEADFHSYSCAFPFLLLTFVCLFVTVKPNLPSG
jgi:hypothetical protein